MTGNSFILLFAGMACAGPPSAADQTSSAHWPVTAVTDGVLVGQAEDSMMMPTAVAVMEDGRVFVADGVNDRIVEFGPDGQFTGSITEIAGQKLSRPLSIKVVGQDLWIADSGNYRALVRGPQGDLLRTIALDSPIDLTDLAVVDKSTAWFVDNDAHRLLRYDLSTDSMTEFGMKGETLGRFHYPFMIEAHDGLIYVSDSMNGRVQAIRGPDVLPRPIGRFGVAPGQFHRPKGIALNSSGQIAVADGSLGTVQFFGREGELIDALRHENGDVFRFESPCGLAIDGAHLYVVELIPNHVRKLRLTFRDARPQFETRLQQRTESQQNSCTLCHLEWIPPFPAGQSTELAAPPPERPNEPYVSSSSSCLSCHDGTVVDSRRRVWRDHGHRTGMALPATMLSPQDLPLVESAISCRTCHSAHTHGGAGHGLDDAVFLRVSGAPDELCLKCHVDYAGNRNTMHPTGAFESPLPDTLIKSGSRYTPEQQSPGCLICHSGHGSKDQRLLVNTPQSEDLCLACHSSLISNVESMANASVHPLRNSGRLKKLFDHGENNADNLAEDLECTSCHRVHHAVEATALLIRPLSDGGLCLQCHSSFSAVQGTPHDLTRLHQKNDPSHDCNPAALCSSCHGVHEPPRTAVSSSVDQEGACLTCHQVSSCANEKTGQPFLHPTSVTKDQLLQLSEFTGRNRAPLPADSLTCLSCHNPHADPHQSKAMIRGADDSSVTELCFQCHSDTRTIPQSFHRSHSLSTINVEAEDECRACHAIHAPTPEWKGDSWVASIGPSSSPESMRCTGCHSGTGGMTDVAFKGHPRLALTNLVLPNEPGFMPLMDEQGQTGMTGSIGCITCHVPHGRPEGGGFLSPKWDSTPLPVIHSTKPMLRPYVVPNPCSSCHGPDGLRLFLDYHQTGSPQPVDQAHGSTNRSGTFPAREFGR